ncbi:MAG: 50S ribosomal protein L4 [Nitrospiraceae bacterium]|nr:50S ribosomal protein L4 [Nitrospiraceae bacterium]
MVKVKKIAKRKKSDEFPVYSADGKVSGSVAVPKVFHTPLRLDVIRRAVVAVESHDRQPYGPSPGAGMRHAVSTWGKGRGAARVQRLTQGNDAAESPNNVGGRRAHPPTVEKSYYKRFNRKEMALARASALAAASKVEIVRERGHRFSEDITALPLVIDDSVLDIEATADAIEFLDTVGLYDDVIRAKEGKHIRAGRGKMRGRRYKVPRSILFVMNVDKPLARAVRNLPGVEVVPPERLGASDLAPGGDVGRLLVMSTETVKYFGGGSE